MKTGVILGAGVMGSAMCLPFADRGMDVRLVGTHLDDEIIASVQAKRFHPKLKVTLPDTVTAFQWAEFAAAARDADFILLGVASAGVGWAIDRLCEVLTSPVPVIMITKGMQPEASTLSALPDVVQRELKLRLGFEVPVAAIAGPCIAGELAVRRHTGTVIVSRDVKLAEMFRAAFVTDYYHPRVSSDMMGAEICAAFKNFFAIAVGWAHGALEVMPQAENAARNNNPAAILFDQAIREMMVMATALGGSPDSVWGMPGAGDLYVTCMAGRNSRLGHNLGRGLTYSQVKAGPMVGETIEGAELGVACAEALTAMMRAGLPDANRIPLTRALLTALTQNSAFVPEWSAFH
jgi:glycerol-3-phosphate dehydrogenase (NAD(P)+)